MVYLFKKIVASLVYRETSLVTTGAVTLIVKNDRREKQKDFSDGTQRNRFEYE